MERPSFETGHTPSRRILVGLCVAMALSVIVPLAASGGRDDVVTLKKIASRLDRQSGVIAIEASDPVAYVASQPDPRLFIVELRNIVVLGFADDFTPDPRLPFAAVQVEVDRAADGAGVARVRMLLAQPMRPRVRSSRNVIYVEADRLDRQQTSPDPIASPGPASAIRDVRVMHRGDATALTLRGTGPLTVSAVEVAKDGPPRLLLDLVNATSALPGAVPIGQDPIDAVSIGINPESPLLTRVAVRLTRRVPYRLESSYDKQDLTIVFDEPASQLSPAPQVPASARQAPAQAAAPPETIVARSLPEVASGTPSSRSRAAGTVTSAQPVQQPPAAATGALAQQALARAQQVPSNTSAALAPQQTARPRFQVARQQPPQQAVAAAAQQQPPAPAAPAGQQPAAPPQFTGTPVSLDFQGADLRTVLRVFAEISGLNIVIDPTIQGTVDVALRDVPWDQALDVILRANRLGYVVNGTIVRIAPLTVLADEESQRQQLAEAQALAGELVTQTFALSYARAEELQPLLTATVLSQRGTTQTDVRTNTLIVTDLQERLTGVADLIATLDLPEPQVEIEARIVQTTREVARALGVQWGFTGRATNVLGNTLPLAFPNQVNVGGRTGQSSGPPAPDQGFESSQTIINLPVSAANSAIGIALGSLNGAVNLDLALSALERQGQGRLLSTPRVSTQNNIEAEITQGVQIPIQTVSNNTVTVEFRDAALTLRVTPQITSANTVIMRITLENASPDFSRSINNIPPIDTQRAITQVLVNDGETTVIGGIFVSREQVVRDRVPALHRIPLLGWLFRRDDNREDSRELLIFVTPRIIKS